MMSSSIALSTTSSMAHASAAVAPERIAVRTKPFTVCNKRATTTLLALGGAGPGLCGGVAVGAVVTGTFVVVVGVVAVVVVVGVVVVVVVVVAVKDTAGFDDNYTRHMQNARAINIHDTQYDTKTLVQRACRVGFGGCAAPALVVVVVVVVAAVAGKVALGVDEFCVGTSGNDINNSLQNKRTSEQT